MYPHKPVLCVADALGAPPRTVEKWFSGESRPSLDMLPAIMTAWGPEFLCAALSEPPGWLTRAVQDERREALRRQQAELDAELREIGA